MQRRNIPALIIVLSALLVACAPGYKKFSIATGGGYYDKALEDGTYKVSYVGNAETEEWESEVFAMRRAAELTLEKGATHFQIITGESKLNHQMSGITPISSSPKTEYIIKLHIQPPVADDVRMFNAAETVEKMIAQEAAGKG